MRQYTIDDAKRLITDFCEEEYGTEHVDFSNLLVNIRRIQYAVKTKIFVKWQRLY